MSNRLIEFLLTRPARERLLMGLLVMAVLPLAIVLGVLMPLQDQKAVAHQTLSDARGLNDWVVERSGEARRLPKGGQGPSAATAPIGSSGIEQSLIAANLRPSVSSLGVRDGGVIELKFDVVVFTQLANWMSANERVWGYDLSAFRFETTKETGKVSASLTLTPPS
jgi:general secretion pathway protein M